MKIARFITFLLLGVSLPLFAEVADVEALQAKSRASFNEHFSKFTLDKNVMGKASTADGSQVQQTPKMRFDADDGNPFQSDLTYHDFAYDVIDSRYAEVAKQQTKPGDPLPKIRMLLAGVSPHGGLAAANGSSLLERTAYQLHDQYSKLEDKKEREDNAKKEGIQYLGMFKKETQEVFKDGPPKKGEDKTPEQVSRLYIRDEAKPEVEQVGVRSFQDVDRDAKDPDKQTDPQAMGTISLYYTAANKALEALWKSTLANLGQARAYRGGDYFNGSSSLNPKLSEDEPKAEDWAKQEIAKIDPNLDAQSRDKRIQEINRMKDETNQVLQTSFKMVNPVFEDPQQNPSQSPGAAAAPRTLKAEDPLKEEGKERDWRVTLEMLNRTGLNAQEVQSNWKYKPQDTKGKVTTQYDDKGNAVGTEQLGMDEQLQRYNNSLKTAGAGLEEVRKRFPGLQGTTQDVEGNSIPLKTLKATDITKYPEKSAYEKYEPVPNQGINAPAKLPENYLDLVNRK